MKAILSLGSNCGDRSGMISDALEKLGGICRILRQTVIYESPDCLGNGSKYMNAIAEIETILDLPTLNLRLKDLEKEAGRTKETRALGLVPLDMDIVVADGIIVRNNDFNSAYFRKGYSLLAGKNNKIVKNEPAKC